MLTRQARLDIERIVWPAGRPGRARDLPASAAIHQLATHDLFSAFLHAGDPLVREGLFAWIPERACAHLFDGFLRPDALAGVRVGDRAIALFIERDLGTERGEVLAEKVRRYRSAFARAPELAIHVAFVVESDRRASTIHQIVNRHQPVGSRLAFLTAVDARVRANPMGVTWSDGRNRRSSRELFPIAPAAPWPILTAGCLADLDALSAMDDRAVAMIPTLAEHLG